MLRFFDFPNGRCHHLLSLKSPNFLANGVQSIKIHEHVKFLQNRPIGCKVLRFFNFSKWRATPSWNFNFLKFYRPTVSGRPRLIIVLNIVKIGLLVVETLHFFEFSKWPPPPSWIFEIAKFYWLLGRRGSRHISMPNFVKIGQSVAKILRFFRFFKMAAAAIFNCQIHKILLADSSRRAQTHHFTEFCQNWSFHSGLLQFFEFSRWPPQPSWIFKIAKFYSLLVSKGSSRNSMPNFVKIGQSVARY